MSFTDIAIGGFKASGKTTVQDYLLKTRNYLSLLACKQPIVNAFEEYAGKTYNKGTDDAALIDYSTNILRKDNPMIVVQYLEQVVPALRMTGAHLISADMRFPQENEFFRQDKFLCLKVEASEEVRKQRMMDRDGSLKNWKPNDDTERFADELSYHYIVDNNTTEHSLFLQVERVIGRHFPRKCHFIIDTNLLSKVRIINENLDEFWEEGYVESLRLKNDSYAAFGVRFKDGRYNFYILDDLMRVA